LNIFRNQSQIIGILMYQEPCMSMCALLQVTRVDVVQSPALEPRKVLLARPLCQPMPHTVER
jgi:hypothetical protein